MNPEENDAKAYLAAKREQLRAEQAIRDAEERAAEEQESQDEDAFESELEPTWSHWITSVVVVLVLIAITFSSFYGRVSSGMVGPEIGVFVAAFPLIFLMFLVGRILSSLAARSALRRWRATVALVVSSEPRVTGHTAQGPMTRPYATYEFEVDGELYRSGTWLSTWSSNTGNAADVCSEFPPGHDLPIRYHPTRPGWSVVDDVGRSRFPTVPIVWALPLICLVGYGFALLFTPPS